QPALSLAVIQFVTAPSLATLAPPRVIGQQRSLRIPGPESSLGFPLIQREPEILLVHVPITSIRRQGHYLWVATGIKVAGHLQSVGITGSYYLAVLIHSQRQPAVAEALLDHQRRARDISILGLSHAQHVAVK